VLIAPPDTAAAAANGPARDEPAIEVEFAGKVRVRIPNSVPVDVPGAASSSAKLLLKLRVKRLPVSRDTESDETPRAQQ